MATWPGWQTQLWTATKVIPTTASTNLLNMMSTFAPQGCRNNPVGISHQTGSSTDCQNVTVARKAQNYGSHADAASAFAAQLESGNFPHLLAAFNSGDPFTVSDPNQVAADLAKWEGGVSEAYLNAVKQSGGGGAGANTTGIHKGWEDFRRSLGTNAPKSVTASLKMTAAALRRLEHARKVRI